MLTAASHSDDTDKLRLDVVVVDCRVVVVGFFVYDEDASVVTIQKRFRLDP